MTVRGIFFEGRFLFIRALSRAGCALAARRLSASLLSYFCCRRRLSGPLGSVNVPPRAFLRDLGSLGINQEKLIFCNVFFAARQWDTSLASPWRVRCWEIQHFHKSLWERWGSSALQSLCSIIIIVVVVFKNQSLSLLASHLSSQGLRTSLPTSIILPSLKIDFSTSDAILSCFWGLTGCQCSGGGAVERTLIAQI